MKEYIKLSTLYTIVAAFPPLLQVLIQPFIEGKGRLSVVDFSHIAITETISAFFFMIAMFAFSGALARFYYDHKDNEKDLKALISGCFSSILLRGLLILGAAFLLKDYIGQVFSQTELQDFSSYGFATIFVGISRAINISAVTLYRNEKKVRKFIMISLLIGIFRVGFQLIGLFYYEMSFIGYVYGSCVGAGIISLAIIIHTYWRNGIKYDNKILKPVYQFAFPLFCNALIGWGILYADRYFLESYPADLGIYDTALRFAMAIEMVLLGIGGAIQPEIFRLMKDGFEKNHAEIKKYSHAMMAQTQLLLAVLILPVMFYLYYFYDSKLSLASNIIAIVFIKFLFRAQNIIFLIPILFLKKTTALFFIYTIVLLINLLLNYILIPVFGIYGAVYANLASWFALSTLTFIYQRIVIKIKWNIKKIYIYPTILVLIALIVELLKNFFNLNLFLSALIVILSIFLSLYLLYKNELKKLPYKKLVGT
ncbi:MAG: hypothetical protein FVQ77_03460 [Cytophagales bacterium]|nr:hypothetical protein [Cytophagales bacterium]